MGEHQSLDGGDQGDVGAVEVTFEREGGPCDREEDRKGGRSAVEKVKDGSECHG